jgi:hypothetical protein
MAIRVRCSWCKEFKALTPKGKLHKHTAPAKPGVPCTGSGQYPTRYEKES